MIWGHSLKYNYSSPKTLKLHPNKLEWEQNKVTFEGVDAQTWEDCTVRLRCYKITPVESSLISPLRESLRKIAPESLPVEQM